MIVALAVYSCRDVFDVFQLDDLDSTYVSWGQCEERSMVSYALWRWTCHAIVGTPCAEV